MSKREWGAGRWWMRNLGATAGAALGAALLLSALVPDALAQTTAQAAAVGRAPGSQPLALVFPLVAHDAGLSRLAVAVTTPGSPQYAHYQPISRLARRFGASNRVRRRTLGYLRSAGATNVRIDATGLFADATMTVARAERLFGTRLKRFRTRRQTFVAPSAAVPVPRGLRGLVRSVIGLDTQPLDRPSVPEALARPDLRAHVAGQPTSAFPRTGTPGGCPAGASAGEQGNDPATAAFTPNQYLTAYGFDQLHSGGFTGQGMRVAVIEIDGFKSSDIATFAQCFGLHLPPVNGFTVGVHGTLPPGGESTLDLEALDAAAPDLKAIDVYETKSDPADTLRAMTAPLQNRGRTPQVISASLGLCEPAVYGAIGARGIVATEESLQIAAISGVTFLASSGDAGSADCIGNDGFPIDRLAVNYPASSTWVTSVGGTNFLLSPSNQITTQVVWNDTNVQPGSAGGGGSSGLFRRPFYQNRTVSSHLRAVPDVAMLSDILPGYAVYCSAPHDCVNAANPNPWQAVGGTSAATPLLAGGFALIDEELKLHHRQGLGLVNPLLYLIGRSSTLGGQVFADVLSYGNDVGPYIPGNGQPLGCCSATRGFDRASGWGSINVGAFAPVALAIQPAQLTLSLPRGQQPLKRHAIMAKISCTGACRAGAYAVVRIARARPFAVESRVYKLHASGAKTIPIRLSGRHLQAVKSALRRSHSVTATVFGVLITGRRRVQFQTAGKQLKIKG